MIIVKIGGSVITDKSRYRYFKSDVCRKIIKVLADLDGPLIVTHGAGSFGHILAKKHGFPGPLTTGNEMGPSQIHTDVLDLDNRVARQMLDYGMRPMQVPPMLAASGRRIRVSQFKKILDFGFTPLSFGDITLRQGFVEIISADDIVLSLARYFHPTTVVFFSDVDGIYDRDPKLYPSARLISNFSDRISFSSVKNDVTGGMREKFRKIKLIRTQSNSVLVINGNRPERLLNSNTDKFVGTVI